MSFGELPSGLEEGIFNEVERGELGGEPVDEVVLIGGEGWAAVSSWLLSALLGGRLTFVEGPF